MPTPKRKRPKGVSRNLLRAVLGISTTLLVVALLTAGSLYALGRSGLGIEKVRSQAQVLLSTLVGEPIDVTFGPAGISVDARRFIGLEMSGLKLAANDDGARLADAGQIAFGIRFLPLLTGAIEIGSARIADARIFPTAVEFRRPEGETRPGWSAGLRNDEGLFDPDKVLTAAFRSVRRAFNALEMRDTQSIELENVELVLGDDGPVNTIRIVRASVERGDTGDLLVSGEFEAAGRRINFDGTAARDIASARIASVSIAAKASPLEETATDRAVVELDITGAETPDAQSPSRLSANFAARGTRLDLGDGDTLTGDVTGVAALVEGTNKIEISRLEAASGRSRLIFNGAIGPDLPGAADDASYRWELVSDGSMLAPTDSPEPALEFVARIAGRYDPQARRVSADEIGLRTGAGELHGSGALTLADRGSPAISLILDTQHMPTGQAKQLWPFFAARGAREWVVRNVFGGAIRDSLLRIDLPAGRLGNGRPLTAAEVSGHFKLDDLRFDIAGDLPPVREAHGEVDFAGADVEVRLVSGTAYLPDGKPLRASEGTLRVRHDRLHFGALDIKVEGDADAAAAFAAHEPINAFRTLDFGPSDFSGKVAGRIRADIPFKRTVVASDIAYAVDLDVENLAVAKPFEGQKLSDAAGQVRIERDRIALDLKGRLNGIPATLAITEPLGRSAVERRRDVALELDDETRRKILPALSTLIDGPVTLKVAASKTPGLQHIDADLRRSTLMVPWIGWTKGAGVPAKLEFDLKMDQGAIALTNLELSGEGFAAKGSVDLAGGSLNRARLTSVRLNKGDEAAIDITKSGKGYKVAIGGSTMDVRSVIRRYLSKEGGGQASGGVGGGDDTPVTVDAKLDSMTGFSGETLSNVSISYRGRGATVDSLSIKAAARSGSPISISNTTEKGQRSIGMTSSDAGAILRFLDIYKHMEGGRIDLALAGQGTGALRGRLDARDFFIVNEPRLSSLVSSAPADDGRSLAAASKRQIDTSRAQFERGFTQIEKGDGYLNLENGILRGPQIGASFQGTLFDANDNMAITGTFMPAYGLNRLFGELPIIGQILGNGRDRGLIGITFKLAGKVASPQLQVNPLSIIAPGIFRSIFEFN